MSRGVRVQQPIITPRDERLVEWVGDDHEQPYPFHLARQPRKGTISVRKGAATGPTPPPPPRPDRGGTVLL